MRPSSASGRFLSSPPRTVPIHAHYERPGPRRDLFAVVAAHLGTSVVELDREQHMVAASYGWVYRQRCRAIEGMALVRVGSCRYCLVGMLFLRVYAELRRNR